jgi:CheY-like chemotaxis protein/two-component sensor histidine kinase
MLVYLYEIFSSYRRNIEIADQLASSNSQLADQNRRKDEFLAMLSHELRSPLAPLSNAVQLLRLQKNEDPLHQQAHGVIERQVRQLKHLVNDLLEVSRITTGRVELVPARSDVRGIVELAVETVRPLIVQRRHVFNVSLAPQPVWANADAARLEQVVVNLLTNAAKYTDEGGHIFLTLEQEGDTAVLRVRDTGVGIAPDLLPCIFDLFTQADRSLDRSQGGLGIGLCLVQRLVELHGGTVKVDSIPGQGSEFVVRLPVMPAASRAASLSPFADRPPAQGKPCRVLAVDDNVDTAQSLAMLLEASGHHVRVARDGPTALQAALDYRPDVVLLDIGLPGLNGYEVAMRIRQQPALNNMVLVAMTGYGTTEDRLRSQEAGFDHHLVKPADFGHVQQILASVSQNVRRPAKALAPVVDEVI